MSLRRRLDSFRFAGRGLSDLFRTQPNARIHAVVALAVVVAGAWLRISRPDWLVIIGCITLVIALEAVNTALEYLTDLVSPDYHPLAGKAKDAAAAAVLIAAAGAVVLGSVVFTPYIIALWR